MLGIVGLHYIESLPSYPFDDFFIPLDFLYFVLNWTFPLISFLFFLQLFKENIVKFRKKEENKN